MKFLVSCLGICRGGLRAQLVSISLPEIGIGVDYYYYLNDESVWIIIIIIENVSTLKVTISVPTCHRKKTESTAEWSERNCNRNVSFCTKNRTFCLQAKETFLSLVYSTR